MFRMAAALLAAPLLLTTACADESDGALALRTGDAAVSALRSAPDAVADAGTARFEIVMEMTIEGKAMEILATGETDAANEQMRMEMDMGSLFEDMAAAEGEELPPAFDRPWEILADGSTMYMRAPVFEMVGVTGWLSISPEDVGATAEEMGFGPGSFDFTQTLESLRGVTGEPEVVGEEQVRGVTTTHYRASMDLSDALANVPAARREELEAAFEKLDATGDLADAEIPVDIWIDEDDLPRRMRMEMDSTFAALGMDDGSMTMTMELFDFGEDVDIVIPSADEVTPMTEALGGLGAGFGS